MKQNDQEILAQLYEEGVWDRMKASASGVAGGVKGFLGGNGYAKSAQSAKQSSLMRGKLSSILQDIQKFETDMGRYKNDQAASTFSKKTTQIKRIINNFNK
jgi:hypothetical protein